MLNKHIVLKANEIRVRNNKSAMENIEKLDTCLMSEAVEYFKEINETMKGEVKFLDSSTMLFRVNTCNGKWGMSLQEEVGDRQMEAKIEAVSETQHYNGFVDAAFNFVYIKEKDVIDWHDDIMLSQTFDYAVDKNGYMVEDYKAFRAAMNSRPYPWEMTETK